MEKNVAVDRQAAMEMIQVSGQQGVPVITVDGRVVVGFNQPRLTQLLGEVHRTKSRSGPRLGASIADAASQVRRNPGIPSAGAFVGRVRSGSPAEQAGLRPGDVITALDGQPVTQADDVHRLMLRLPRGHDVSLSYVRDGQERDTLVRLES